MNFDLVLELLQEAPSVLAEAASASALSSPSPSLASAASSNVSQVGASRNWCTPITVHQAQGIRLYHSKRPNAKERLRQWRRDTDDAEVLRVLQNSRGAEFRPGADNPVPNPNP